MIKSIKVLQLFSAVITINLIGCSAQETVNPNNYTDRQNGYGARVIVETVNAEVYSGELLNVSDTVIIISAIYGVSDSNLAKGIYPLYPIHNDQITLITVKGDKFLFTGIVIGGGTGLLLGTAIGVLLSEEENFIFFKQTKEETVASSACCLGITGGVVGGLLGIAVSSKDEIIYNYNEPAVRNYILLKNFARYPEEGPDYIHLPNQEFQ